jgi:hypothetical protein
MITPKTSIRFQAMDCGLVFGADTCSGIDVEIAYFVFHRLEAAWGGFTGLRVFQVEYILSKSNRGIGIHFGMLGLGIGILAVYDVRSDCHAC